MKKIIFLLFLFGCNSKQDQTKEKNYSYTDYLIELVDYETTPQNLEHIETTGDNKAGFVVSGYNLNKQIYFKYTDDAKDTTAMQSEALQAIQKLKNENH
jgi:hypothetical protein